MRTFKVIFTLLIFCPFSVAASSIFTCEANRISGNEKTLKVTEYPIVYPTIIIDEEYKGILVVYTEHGQKWETLYNIIESDKFSLIGQYRVQPNWIAMIHFNLKEKLFSTVFAGDTGNTVSFGRCYGG